MTSSRAPEEDSRYFLHSGRRWRKTDPAIPSRLNAELVAELMSARRAVKGALKLANASALAAARQRVGDAKRALGERGRPWWDEPTPESLRTRMASVIRSLLRHRGPSASICPSDAARVAAGANWRAAMPLAREVGLSLQSDGLLTVTQQGSPALLPVVGPVIFMSKEGFNEA